MPKSVRDIAIVFILLGIGLIILFSSDKTPAGSTVGKIVYTVLKPFQEVVYAVQSRVGNVWHTYVDLVKVQEESAALKEEIRKLRREKAVLLDKEDENRRLKKLLNLKTRHELPSLVAQILGEDAAGWYHTFFISRGSEDGVVPGMAVTASEGVVGKVIRSSADMSQVLLLTDPNLSVDCRVARTRDRGILTGSLERGCVLRHISLKSDVKIGDEVVTSGLDGVFPRGLTVGRVTKVGKGGQGLFLEAQVKPAVDFSAIEEVLVVLGQKGGFDVQPGLEERR